MEAIPASGYAVYFNESIYAYLQDFLTKKSYSGIYLLADSNTSLHCLPVFLSQLATDLPIEIIEFEPGESNKNIETCVEIWHALTDLGADRKSLIINIGGGVVTDLGGFVAATFKRGVDFINVPTSLLAMVDASVGGKTGIDLGVLKNQVGLILNPVAVLVDTNFLETLPAEEMRSGLAEMLKHGLIADKNYWEKFLNLGSLTTDDLSQLIYDSIAIKNQIVIADPYEKGIRKMLNFGHTLGHAIESHFMAHPFHKPLLHGEAIAVGMILESYLSKEKNYIIPDEYASIKLCISGIYEKVEFEANDITAIMDLMMHDKKNEGGSLNFTLLETTGKAIINQHVEKLLIYKAFEDYQN